MALVQNARASSEEWMLLEQETFASTVKFSGIFLTYISPKLLWGKRRFQEPFFPQTHQNHNLESTGARSFTLFWNKCHYSHVMKDENSAQKGWGAGSRAPSAKGRKLHLVLQDTKQSWQKRVSWNCMEDTEDARSSGVGLKAISHLMRTSLTRSLLNLQF